MVIRSRSGAKLAARQRRTSRAEGEDTTGANRRAQRLHVPRVESKPQCRLSREATGLYIARTASGPERKTAVAEGVAIAVNLGTFDTNGPDVRPKEIATTPKRPT